MKYEIIDSILKIALGAIIAVAIISMTSCASGRWYSASHDGCQSSQGFIGYGNPKH